MARTKSDKFNTVKLEKILLDTLKEFNKLSKIMEQVEDLFFDTREWNDIEKANKK